MNPETVTSTVENDEVESMKRKAKRAANSHRDRVRRGRYFGSENEQLRCSRLEKQRERSEQNRATKTEEEKKLLQEEKNRKKRERRYNETSNQKFWRLLRRRQYRKFGEHLLTINFEYHRSKNQYGIDIDYAANENFLELSDVGLKTLFSVFKEMLDLALIGSPLPENKFKIFDHYGIYLPEDFFTNYIDDLSSLS